MDFTAFDCFKNSGVWYKGNLHSHTTNSDGAATPDELVDWYWKNGYDFLAITDHDVITDVTKLQRDGLLLIHGIEFGYRPAEDPDFLLDMLGINMKELPEFLDPNGTGHIEYDVNISPQRIIDHINSVDGIAIMCHPYFMINMTEPYLRYHSYLGMEAYNFLCEAQCGRGHQEIYWDAMLLRNKKLWGFATDDSHPAEFGFAWIEVKAREKTIPAILDAIRAGEFYATNGIKIYDVQYDDKTVRVTFDRPCNMALMPSWSSCIRMHKNGSELVDGKIRYYAEAEIPWKENYCRIELTDACGKKAYLNPVYLRD